jgi:hypothetical protein
MTGRPPPGRSEPGLTLPALDRLAPPPPPSLVVARIDAHTGPGEIVADLFGRGGWIARAGLDRQRRVVSLEASPLTRMLAEVVLRPPDVRHLDAAFQGIAASPRRDSSLKVSLGDLFGTRCATCGRTLVADEIIWHAGDEAEPARPLAKRYRCTVCRDQRGGGEQREAPLDADDLRRAIADVGAADVRRDLGERFPPIDGAEDLVDELLDLHTPRQLVGLAAIVARIEGDLRAAPVLAALRLAVLHAILPASRLATQPGRTAPLRVAGGHVRLPGAAQWRERSPWLAFEEGFRTVRGFVQGLEGGTLGPVPARIGEDLRSLDEGTATALLGLTGPTSLRTLGLDGRDTGRGGSGPRVRLVLSQPPLRPSLDRLAAAYHGTAWVLGREAASLVPAGALAGSSLRAPWSWQSAAIGRTLEAIEPALARDGRVVLLVDGGPEALVSAVLGGSAAGHRLVTARLGDGDDEHTGVVELLPPNAVLPPGPRTRANVSLEPVPGGAGDPDLVPGPGLFAAPEHFDERPFSEPEAARKVADTAVEMLRARGEPARYERLLGEILVGLDRGGQLRRYATASSGASADEPAVAPEPSSGTGPSHEEEPPAEAPESHGATSGSAPRPTPIAHHVGRPRDGEPSDPVERLLRLIHDELSRPSQHRLVEIEPGRWWLADRADREAAAQPLADRVEWSIFSLLSTAGPLPESAFFERVAALFTGHDLADEALVRACLDSYRSRASTPERIVTGDDLLRRSQEHSELLAALADGGHRLGMQVWLGRREQTRRIDGRPLGDWLTEREREGYLAWLGRAEELHDVDCIWYVRGKLAFLFEVEWTAMLGEPLLRRHARIPPDERLIRFLVIAPERTELVRYKLARSPLLRAAVEDGPWHIIKSDHLRTFLERDELHLDALEPFVGLDPLVERSSEQLPLFGS